MIQDGIYGSRGVVGALTIWKGFLNKYLFWGITLSFDRVGWGSGYCSQYIAWGHCVPGIKLRLLHIPLTYLSFELVGMDLIEKIRKLLTFPWARKSNVSPFTLMDFLILSQCFKH